MTAQTAVVQARRSPMLVDARSAILNQQPTMNMPTVSSWPLHGLVYGRLARWSLLVCPFCLALLGGRLRAAKVDSNQSAIVKALRAYGCSVQHLHTVGQGCPDLLIATPPNDKGQRRLGLIEVKDGDKPPSARGLTDDQVKWWDEWKGVPMALVTDVEGALRFARVLAFEAGA